MTMEFELDKESSFVLEMKIEGEVSSNEPPKMRFSILCDNYTISLNAKRTGNGVYEIDVPKLEGIASVGEYEALIEVFIDGKHFTPLKEKVKFKHEMKPTVKITEKKEALKENSITVSNIEIRKPVVKKLDEVISR